MIRPLLLLAAVLLPAAAPVSGSGSLTLQVWNIRNSHGRVHVDVCPQDKFLKENCPYSAAAPAHEGMTLVTVPNLPAGRYAVQAFHDENSNDKVDRVLFGQLPKEGLAFSNDAFKRLAAPTWADAQFAFTGQPTTIQMKMRYLIGSSGPAKH